MLYRFKASCLEQGEIKTVEEIDFMFGAVHEQYAVTVEYARLIKVVPEPTTKGLYGSVPVKIENCGGYSVQAPEVGRLLRHRS